MFGKVLAGLIGVASGVALAAWAETLDSGESSELELDEEFDGELDESETTVDEENDPSLEEQPDAV
ncbi:MAG TPA: hypothetical protein PKW56_07790 [Clostridiales bacterium]|nr:hypothetical protein [Clostridiales bacterium]